MKHHLAIAAIFKHENPYLEEWIEYHLLVGCDHLYLYDNDGSDEVRELLAPYFRAGVVSHHPFTWINVTRHDRPTHFGGRDKNHVAFGHAARHYRREFDWIMKIDIAMALARRLIGTVSRMSVRSIAETLGNCWTRMR